MRLCSSETNDAFNVSLAEIKHRYGIKMKDIELIYEDEHLCVAIKPQGLDSEHTLPEAIHAQFGLNVLPVHRLDKDAGGLIVYAKTKPCAAGLSRLIAEGGFDKEYLAVVLGKPVEDSGVLEDWLFRDAKKNKSYAVKTQRKGTKLARLEYKVIKTLEAGEDVLSLVRVKLLTGRTHQIRVQFASRKLPLMGDVKYGGKREGIKLALWSNRLGFTHPIKHMPMSFEYDLPQIFPWMEFEK